MPGAHYTQSFAQPILSDSPIPMIHLSNFVFSIQSVFNAKASRTYYIRLELSRLRSLYQIELDFRDVLLKASHPRFCYCYCTA